MGDNGDSKQDEPPAHTLDQASLDEYEHLFDGISDARKQVLNERFWSWIPGQVMGNQLGPFDGEHLARLEILWLCEQTEYRTGKEYDPDWPWDRFPLPLAGVDLIGEDLKGVNLSDAYLQSAKLGEANLKGASLARANLKWANLYNADLENARLTRARLTGAILENANLENAELSGANLEGAYLGQARLKGANLTGACLKSANLTGANLDHADLAGANLEHANLREASFSKTTKLSGALLSNVLLDRVIFDNANLTVVEWECVPILGDEMEAHAAQGYGDIYIGSTLDLPNPFDAPRQDNADKVGLEYGFKSSQTRVDDYAAATRAYRLLANALRSQGIGDDADRYAFRAQVMRRKQLWHQRRWMKFLWMRFLSFSVGYGYRPWQVVGTYLIVVTIFAIVFWLAGSLGSHTPFTWQAAADAVQISLNAIHGRVFFAQFRLDTFQSWLATAESVIGIVIEAIFVAALIQRLFAR